MISDNSAEVNSKITLQENTLINSTINSRIMGLQGYISGSDIDIDGAIISGGGQENNTEIINPIIIIINDDIEFLNIY